MADEGHDESMDEHDAAMARGRAGLPPKWSVKGYKDLPTFEGVAYSGRITLKRGFDAPKEVAFFVNHGDGGSTRIEWGYKAARDEWSRLAKSLLPDMGEPDYLLLECLLDNLGLGMDSGR